MKNLTFIILLLLTGCTAEDTQYVYTEKVLTVPTPAINSSSDPHAFIRSSSMDTGDASIDQILEDSAMKPDITWVKPSGWVEQSGSGMRLATLTATIDSRDVVTSIVVLGGQAGGVDANITRWLGQIGFSLNASELSNFLASREVIKIISGEKAEIFDFTKLTKDLSVMDNSMLAAIILDDAQIIFIKTTGSSSDIAELKNDFTKFVSTLNLNIQ
jgi:hypothetical protein